MGIVIFVNLLLSLASSTGQFSDIPSWAMEHMEMNVGRWVADNSAYASNVEPIDSYVLEWEWGIGQQSLKGRLFGFNRGKPTDDFWEFRVFWHPGEEKLRILQFGGQGIVAEGEILWEKEGNYRSIETFYHPDGSIVKVGHRIEYDEREQYNCSFEIDEAGNWNERRCYTWKKLN